MKIVNEALANLEVGLRHGLVKFDEHGIADVEPDEYALELLELDSFYPVNLEGEKVEEPKVPEEASEEVPEAPEDEDIDPSTLKEGEYVDVKVDENEQLDLEGMTGKELDKLAEELKIEDYPKTANVGTRRAAIGDFLAKK